ncbi:MAG TPA: hypothetical protein VF631_01015 [Allosphingosinicella sp.]|uniref:hypothetical protein n=1 Tax=Allosphingosinicella sp. TaxID=2823234 RepID=UPI002F28E013
MLTKLQAYVPGTLLATVALLAGCGGPDRPPPPPLSFDGLPVSGSLSYALKSRFTRCLEDTTEMRCRRDGVMFLGFGPFNAALDLNGSNGGGGFDQLTLWHDRDQNAFLPIVAALERQGWRSCFTGEDDRGDQAIYTHARARARISMDLSYWGKRRLRVIPEWNNREPRC